MNRITINEGLTPTIRNLNIGVDDVLRWLGSGTSENTIIEQHPGLEREDVLAIFNFAADCVSAASSMEQTFGRVRKDITTRLKGLKSNKQRTTH